MMSFKDRQLDTAELRRFMDAVREYIDLRPLYSTGESEKRDCICMDTLSEGPAPLTEMSMRVFGDASNHNMVRISAIMTRLKRQGKARKLRMGWWEAA